MGLSAVAAVAAYVIWIIVSKIIDEVNDPVKEEHKRWWRIGQWVTAGVLVVYVVVTRYG